MRSPLLLVVVLTAGCLAQTKFLVSGLGCLALVHLLDGGHGPQRLAAVWPRRTA